MNNYYLSTKTKSIELGSKEGEVTIAVNTLKVCDYQNDISAQGSFVKTLSENFKNIRHYLNHNSNILIGCPISGYETDNELVFKSALCLDMEVARDVYALYKLYSKYGNTLQHSVGVEDIKRDPSDHRIVKEWKLYEFSTLTKVGASPGTRLLELKELGIESNPNKAVEILKEMLNIKAFSEQFKENTSKEIEIITQQLKNNEPPYKALEVKAAEGHFNLFGVANLLK